MLLLLFCSSVALVAAAPAGVALADAAARVPFCPSFRYRFSRRRCLSTREGNHLPHMRAFLSPYSWLLAPDSKLETPTYQFTPS